MTQDTTTEELQSIARITMGRTFRSRMDVIPSDYGISVVTMKDLHNSTVNTATLTKLNPLVSDSKKPPRPEIFLRPDDIIVRTRGLTTTAAIVPENIGEAIFSSPLVLIRLNKDSGVLPKYLLWYINQPPTQKYFARMSEGSSLQMVSIKHLRHLKIPIPPAKKQERIIEIDSILTHEISLLEQIKEKKRKHTEHILMESIFNNHLENQTTKNQAIKNQETAK